MYPRSYTGAVRGWRKVMDQRSWFAVRLEGDGVQCIPIICFEKQGQRFGPEIGREDSGPNGKTDRRRDDHARLERIPPIDSLVAAGHFSRFTETTSLWA